MDDPGKTLPQAMMLSIGLVLGIYVLVSLAVLGNLSPAQVAASKDYALAEAARPVFGGAGFAVMTFAALVSAASSLNANLYATTNIAYQMAKDGELPTAFAEPIGHSREGLLVSSVRVAILAATLDLGSIAGLGAVTVLIVQSVDLRLTQETGAPRPLVAAALLGTVGATGFALLQQAQSAPGTLGLLVATLGGSVVFEVVQRRGGRVVTTRTS